MNPYLGPTGSAPKVNLYFPLVGSITTRCLNEIGWLLCSRPNPDDRQTHKRIDYVTFPTSLAKVKNGQHDKLKKLYRFASLFTTSRCSWVHTRLCGRRNWQKQIERHQNSQRTQHTTGYSELLVVMIKCRRLQRGMQAEEINAMAPSGCRADRHSGDNPQGCCCCCCCNHYQHYSVTDEIRPDENQAWSW